MDSNGNHRFDCRGEEWVYWTLEFQVECLWFQDQIFVVLVEQEKEKDFDEAEYAEIVIEDSYRYQKVREIRYYVEAFVRGEKEIPVEQIHLIWE